MGGGCVDTMFINVVFICTPSPQTHPYPITCRFALEKVAHVLRQKDIPVLAAHAGIPNMANILPLVAAIFPYEVHFIIEHQHKKYKLTDVNHNYGTAGPIYEPDFKVGVMVLVCTPPCV